MKKELLKWGSAFALAGLCAAVAPAAPVPVYDIDPGGDAPGIPADSKAQTAADALQSRLVKGSQAIENFESYAAGAAPGTWSFRAGDGSVRGASAAVGNGKVDDQPYDLGGEEETYLGRFNTTLNGKNFWETSTGFKLAFDAGFSFSAFGFYLTDFGDFDGGFEVWLTDEQGKETRLDYLPTKTVVPTGTGGVAVQNDPQAGPNGSLEFIGFYDEKMSYRAIEVRITQGTGPTDFLGFDDLFVGNVQRTGGGDLPEPGSLALVGASLLGLAALRRRRA